MSVDRIARVFAEGRRVGRSLVVPFVTAGFPNASSTVPLVRALSEAGADMVEIGMPFSDPLADGPTIQHSSEVALRNGMSVAGALSAVRELRDGGLDTPLILMGYCNPLYAYGMDRFLDDASAVAHLERLVPVVEEVVVPDDTPDRLHGDAAETIIRAVVSLEHITLNDVVRAIYLKRLKVIPERQVPEHIPGAANCSDRRTPDTVIAL